MGIDIHDILNQLDNVKGNGSQYTAKCPAHDDRRNSLSVSVGDDGRVLLKCHAGCDVQDIVGAVGLQMKDLFVEPPPKNHPPVVAAYDYMDDAGKLLA